MKRTNWVDRKFSLGLPEGWLPNTISRLEGTGPRLDHLTLTLSDQQLCYKPGGKWSIKEHIGHLLDLEDLHIGRVHDFKLRKETLRAADMSNKKTYDENHNQKICSTLLNGFKLKRMEFTTLLINLEQSTQVYISKHPRLLENMKPVDLAFFTAEHDDHHLASISEILKSF